ncbi:MAG: hypothetical protein K2O16_10160 [Lachnospiraceae bacterium]|nr:hypothetical protein [Lachnospiraceae bacterium]MDE7332584.1 hypothetical protein [Lachnospiraceae bacterium]
MPEKISMGQKLAQAHADKGKILFHTAIRLTLAGIIVLAGIRGNPPGKPVSFAAGLLAAVIALIALIWVLFPLIHLRDCLEFYETGIVIGKQSWTREKLGEISFMDVKNNYSLFGQTYMCTEVRRFNVTYIKEAKKNFNRAYFNGI